MVLDSDNGRTILDTVLNTINNEVQHDCHDEVFTMLNAHLIRQWNAD